MINLYRMCLKMVLCKQLKSNIRLLILAPEIHNFYSFLRINQSLCMKSTLRSCATLSNGRFNQQIINDSREENPVFIEKFVQKLNEKMKNSDKISRDEFERVLDVVRKEGCTKDQGSLLLQCCAESLFDVSPAEQLELTLSTWDVLKRIGSVPLEGYHMLLLSLSRCQSGRAINAKDILTEIKMSNLVPNEETYLKLLHFASSVGDIDQVTWVVSMMKDAGIPLNNTVFNYIILGQGRAGNLKEAEDVFKLMCDTLIQPSSATYTALMKAAAETNDKQKFLLYFNKYRTELSNLQRLEIVESLSISKLIELIPMVLDGGSWKSDENLTNAMINTCKTLIHSGHVDCAFVIFDCLHEYIKNNSDADNESAYGLFFIQEIVKSNAPLNLIKEVCDKLHSRNSYALFRATEAALINDKQYLALQLLQSLCDLGHKLRQHYFWPLLTSAGRTNGEEGVLKILDEMLKFGVLPNCETLTEWVCVYCNLSKPVELVRKFQDKGLTLNSVLTAVVQSLLFKNDLKGASALCEKFRSNIEWDKEKFTKLLSLEFLRTRDIHSVMKILNLVKDKKAGSDMVNFILTQRRVPFENHTLLRFVQVLEKSGFPLTQELYDALNGNYRGRKINGINNSMSRPYISHPKDMSVSELEDHLLELKNKKMNTRGVLRRLLQEHRSSGNTERVLEIKKELEDDGMKFSAGMMASLLETFVAAGLLQEADKCFSDIKENYPTFKLDTYKVVDLATFYVKNGNFQNAVDILKKQENVRANESFAKNCFRLLNAVAEIYGPDKTKEMFDLLVSRNYCAVKNPILGPVMRSYLMKEDFNAALNFYEKCSLDYSCTPLQHELLCSLLAKESQEELQLINESSNREMKTENIYSDFLKRAVTVGEKVHGKKRTVISVVVALAECGLIHKLMQFMEESRQILSTDILLKSCNRLADENKLNVLQTILKAAKNLSEVKIENLYDILLKVYVRRNDCDGALSLWTSLQEEDVTASEKFMKDLAALLYSNKKKIPFVVPESKNENNVKSR